MQAAQWIIAAVTAIFVALVAYLQWRTAQQKAVLDLFDRRHEIYEIVRKAVGTMASNSTTFDQSREIEFMQAMERAYFFFGDDVDDYIKRLWFFCAIMKASPLEAVLTESRVTPDSAACVILGGRLWFAK